MPKAQKVEYWAKQIQRKFGFSAEEIGMGVKHPILEWLEQFRLGEHNNDELVRAINQMQIRDGETNELHRLQTTADEVYEMAVLFFQGMHQAVKDANHGKFSAGLFPKKVLLKSPQDIRRMREGNGYNIEDGEVSMAFYIPPRGGPEPDTVIINHDTFAYAAYDRQLNKTAQKTHSTLLDQELSWDEELYTSGGEEIRHACQYKVPELSEKMAREISALVEAGMYQPGSYDGGDPFENDAGVYLSDALRAYRAQKLGR